jgi:hypothetical protein
MCRSRKGTKVDACFAAPCVSVDASTCEPRESVQMAYEARHRVSTSFFWTEEALVTRKKKSQNIFVTCFSRQSRVPGVWGLSFPGRTLDVCYELGAMDERWASTVIPRTDFMN